MKLLCLDIPLPAASPEKYQEHLLAEVRHGWQLHKAGIIREIYARKDRAGVAIIVESASVEEARDRLMEFPFAQKGFIDWEIIPLGPFEGWGMLFEKGPKEV